MAWSAEETSEQVFGWKEWKGWIGRDCERYGGDPTKITMDQDEVEELEAVVIISWMTKRLHLIYMYSLMGSNCLKIDYFSFWMMGRMGGVHQLWNCGNGVDLLREGTM